MIHICEIRRVCLVMGLALSASACTIYKSGERDTFNQNALAGAPKSLVAAHPAIAKDTGAESCWIASDTQSSVEVDEDRQLITVHEGTLVCLFSFQTYDVDSRAQVERDSTRLNEF